MPYHRVTNLLLREFFKSSVYFAEERKKIKEKLVFHGKCKKYEAEISIRDGATILDNENIQLKVKNYEFGEGPDFIALETLPPRIQERIC